MSDKRFRLATAIQLIEMEFSMVHEHQKILHIWDYETLEEGMAAYEKLRKAIEEKP